MGTLAAGSTSSRDRVIKEGALSAILDCMESKIQHRAATRLAAWAMSHICGGFPKPHLSSDLVVPWLLKVLHLQSVHSPTLIPPLQLLSLEDEETVSHACWSLSHVIDGPSSPFAETCLPLMTVERCEELTRPLIVLLGHSSWRITKPALRVLGNIVCSDGVVSALCPSFRLSVTATRRPTSLKSWLMPVSYLTSAN